MASPFGVPDEFIEGLLKAGQNLAQAFAGVPAADPTSAAPGDAPKPSLPELQARFWIDGRLGDDPQQWLASAQAVPGSWWTH